MGLIAIAANPASGRDIRRLMSRASVYNNGEKANIVERVILAAHKLGNHTFAIMPDSYQFGNRIIDDLVDTLHEVPAGTIQVPDLMVTDRTEDTQAFAQWAEESGADVLIILGGDGTSRAAAKGVKNIPTISLSTGTNNVYPIMMEGTVVGMAASALADGAADLNTCTAPCKRIEVWKNGEFVDLALIDVVFSNEIFVGARALWDRESISRVVVTQSHPASIGFSALLGGSILVTPEEPFGAAADCAEGSPNTIAALSAGVMARFRLENVRKVALDEPLVYQMETPGILAFDGERELGWKKGDQIELRVTRKGPVRVDVKAVLEQAQRAGYFQRGEKE